MTSSTWSPFNPERSTVDLMTAAPKRTVGTVLSAPWKLPMGVRAMAVITEFLDMY
jgi:hypothetical protein